MKSNVMSDSAKVYNKAVLTEKETTDFTWNER